MIKSEIDGKTPINCPEHVGRNNRKIKRLIGRSSWFQNNRSNNNNNNISNQTSSNNNNNITFKFKRTTKSVKRKHESVLFVPYTPGSVLKKTL